MQAGNHQWRQGAASRSIVKAQHIREQDQTTTDLFVLWEGSTPELISTCQSLVTRIRCGDAGYNGGGGSTFPIPREVKDFRKILSPFEKKKKKSVRQGETNLF